MHRLRWLVLIVLICLPVAVLALGWHIPGFEESTAAARPRWVDDGDQEMAWLHTTTANTTWERFVSGLARVPKSNPEIEIDTSRAFPDSTTAVPEVAIGRKGRDEKLRIRWYKLQTEVTAADWVNALAERDPAPLAVIGGGSSDRAFELARAMQSRQTWNGDRPALFLTTATANKVVDKPPESIEYQLADVYDDRTFRFCFSDRQMARAVLDFVWSQPDLRPDVFENDAFRAAISGAVSLPNTARFQPHVFSTQWRDDPYSEDLHDQFHTVLYPGARDRNAGQLTTYPIDFSVGGFDKPNIVEGETARSFAEQIRKLPPQRSLLILPTSTQPARRILRAIVERSPRLTRRLVVVTGDGIPINAILRDGDFAWRAGALPVPLVLFAHNDPIAWDDGIHWPRGAGHDANSTEDVMHFAEMGRIVSGVCFPAADRPLLNRSGDLIARLHSLRPAYFDPNGERIGGTGEYVVTLIPRDDAEGTRGTATLTVHRREPDKTWTATGRLIVGVPAEGHTP